MSLPRGRSLPVIGLGLVVAIGFVDAVFGALIWANGEVPAVIVTHVVVMPMSILFFGMGALILARYPGHLIGKVMSICGVLIALVTVAEAYSQYGLITRPGSLPAPEYAAWFATWAWVPAGVPILTLLLLLCPDGRLPSSRWWPVAALTGAVLTCISLSRAVMPGDIDQFTGIENPLAIESLGGVADVGAAIGFFSLVPAALGSAASMVWRFRRSRGQERLQLKWFALAAIVAGLTLFVSMALLFAGIDVWTVSFPLAASFIGVAAGMAVLREGLYDVDRIINRTLVYALLTATLAAVYVVVVLVLQAIFRPISGGSDLSIAITTLIVAALFMPAQRRVQMLVDQRFNRRAYDAARTLDAFGARLRQNLDLETLQSDLVTVVKQTMEPSRISVWLRSGRDVMS